MMMIAAVVGARPNIIKHAALAPFLPPDTILIHTGQHYDYEMSQVFFEHLEIPLPEVNLNIKEDTECRQVGSMLIELEKFVKNRGIDMMVVYGDTNSSLAGALCANKLKIRLAHVEAGVRHFNRTVPEENNRVLIDHISDLLFCPTYSAVSNLKRENCQGAIIFSGDLHLDLFVKFESRFRLGTMKNLKTGFSDEDYMLATVHRQSNTDIESNLRAIIEAFLLAKMKIVFPVHPRTKKALRRYSLWESVTNCKNLAIIDPVNYVDFMCLLLNAQKVLTDSGGVQKEAFFAGKQCITLRDYSPWPETQVNKWNLVIPATVKDIVSAIEENPEGTREVHHFGDGHAAEKMAKFIVGY